MQLRTLPMSIRFLWASLAFVASCVIAADFDGDGHADISWHNSVTGQIWNYHMDGALISSSQHIITISNLDWQIVGNGDYNGDGNSDILLRNLSTGQIWMYLMDGAMIVDSDPVKTISDLKWRVVASGDFNGDTRDDILLRHTLTGQNWIYLMNGPTVDLSQYLNTIANLNWQFVGVGDFDGDSKSDLLLRHSVTGQNWLYLMDGAMVSSSLHVNTVANTDWAIDGIGDFDANGKSDIFWRNQITGQNWMYLMDGATISASAFVGSVANLDWEAAVTEDFDGDAKADVLWRNKITGQNILHFMDGATIADGSVVNTVSNLDWVIANDKLPSLTPSGLNARPSNLSCVAPAQPTTNASIAVAEAFPNLPTLVRPLALMQAPGDSSQWYVVEKDGRVRRFDNSPTVDTVDTFIDIRSAGGPVDVDSSANESGLLGMAFHPNYLVNRQVFLSYTVDDTSGTYEFFSRVSRFTSTDNGLTLDPNSEEVLLSVPQPFNNHNGGNILFGPDGFLYIGFGDGGSGGDPGDRAQNTNNLFGSILRIDVDGGYPYAIPGSNPNFGNTLCDAGSGVTPCPEIYAWGFRNPWRWSFDSVTGDLWVADVGEDHYEEVDIVELGGNYGWRCREGAHDYNTTGNCPSGLIDPIIELSHIQGDGASITGGFVYRGSAIPELIGRYVFSDYINGKIFASTSDGQGGYEYEVLLDTSSYVASLAEDENGELLLADYLNGEIRRIVQSGGSSNNTIPNQLSATGCVNAIDATQPTAGLIPYDINAPFWSDGAQKERFYAIPDGTTIDIDADGDWLFPNGTVLMKNFRLNGELFETRLFMRHTNGEWGGYTYEWNQAGTDATRVVGGKTKTVQGQSWTYPSESQCMSCHTQAANFSLGIERAHLNRNMTYPSGVVANQLDTAEMIGMLSAPLEDEPENLPKFYDLTGIGTLPPTEDLEDASRSYLHSNCAGCHRPFGPTPSGMDLRYSTSFAGTNTCNVNPTSGSLGVPNAELISPGMAAESIIPNRMNRRDVHGMPPLASAVSDADGVALINQWINSLTSCP